MIYVYYQDTNKKEMESYLCEQCNAMMPVYKVVRIVKPGEWSYVAGYNMGTSYYCGLECMKKSYEAIYDEVKFVKVKKNTINEIKSRGYPA